MATGGTLKQVPESNRKKFSNWLQCINALNETKTALHDNVLEEWKKELISWDKDIRDDIPRFLRCVSKGKTNFPFKKQKDGKENTVRRREWYCTCGHTRCKKILIKLLDLQQNSGPSIIWNSRLCKELAEENPEIEAGDDADEDEIENIPRVETSILAVFLQMLLAFIGLAPRQEGNSSDVVTGTIRYSDIFDGCKQEHVWCIANMFMQHGKSKTTIMNTGPGNTDASMFFKMMKNCKLFDIEDKFYLYDDILRCRDRLHHSATNRIPEGTAETYLKTMIAFLGQFEQIPNCIKTSDNIQKMLDETLLSVSVPDKSIRELSEKALNLKKFALEVDKDIDISNGFPCDETNDLLKKTKIELQHVSCSPPQMELINTGSGQDNKFQQSLTDLTDPAKHFENMSQLVTKFAQNEEILEALTEQLNPLLYDIVEAASEKDEQLKESLKEINVQKRQRYRLEGEPKISKLNDSAETEIPSVFDNISPDKQLSDIDVEAETDTEEPEESQHIVIQEERHGHSSEVEHEDTAQNDSVETFPSQFDNISRSGGESSNLEALDQMSNREFPEEFTSNVERHSNVRAVINKRQYRLNLNDGSDGRRFLSCCRISPAEILLTDGTKKKLKKLDNNFHVIKELHLDTYPFDLCYVGNNECIVALQGRKLQFVDIRDDMKQTKTVNTTHVVNGLAFDRNSLYVIDDTSVYVYRPDGMYSRVLYKHSFENPTCRFRRIATSHNGCKIYITCSHIGLITIDSSGQVIHTLNDQEIKYPWGVCVDDKGYVLVCDWRSANILQATCDGAQKIGTIENRVEGEVNTIILFFDKCKDELITSGKAGTIFGLKLK